VLDRARIDGRGCGWIHGKLGADPLERLDREPLGPMRASR
jgi:hypothetical protein